MKKPIQSLILSGFLFAHTGYEIEKTVVFNALRVTQKC